MKPEIKRRIVDLTMKHDPGYPRAVVEDVLAAMERAGVAPDLDLEGRPARLVRSRPKR